MRILKMEFALLRNKYALLKRLKYALLKRLKYALLKRLKLFLKNVSTTLQFQLNYHTLPFTPFKINYNNC